MSAARFIEALEERGLLSDRLMTKLRAKLARSKRPPTAKSIAKFLVEKDHLSQREATEVLGSLVRSGIDVDPVAEEDIAEFEPADEATPIISPASSTEIASNPLPQLPADAAEGDDSSIFDTFPSSHIDADADRGPEQELELAPDSELDALPEDKPAATRKPIEEETGGELPALGDMFGMSSPSRPDRPMAAERPLLDEMRESPAEAPLAIDTKVKRRKKKTKAEKRTNEWDSPLILLGGGGLAVLLLGGFTIAWLLNTESADEKLTRAQKAIDSGSYTQAIAEYQEFLKEFPRHSDRGMARVKLAMARLRKATEASNYAAALDVAGDELEAVEDEEKFGELAHAELAALLPRIALGLAKEAESASEPNAAKKLVEQSTAALGLASNTKYVPKSFRDEAELGEVRETLGRVERRQQSQADLRNAIAAIGEAIAAGDTRAAYAHHVTFIKEHPELSGEPSLTDMVAKATAAEQAAIRFVADEAAAETGERSTPWLASLAIANRRVKPTSAAARQAAPGPAGAATCFRLHGALYALDTVTGQLLWRRHVGTADRAWPVAIEQHVLIADAGQHELLRLEAATGKLIWRQTIGEPFAQPLVVGERGFIAADSGRLYVIDLVSGSRMGYVEFAQPLRVAPAVDRDAKRLYLTGDHSSLYTLSLADLNCLGVYYLGHAAGSITVSPAPVMNKLAVLENDGVETSRLRVMTLGEDGVVAGQVVEKRLTGLATSPPFVAGRRLILDTDRGQIDVYEVATGDGDDALTLLATRAASGTKPVVRHAALTANHIWVGDTGLTKYSILPTGNRLPVESIENNYEGATFNHPLALSGKMLIQAHRPKGRAGFVVAAVDTTQGRTLWETDLAMPPAGAPVVDSATRSLAVASAEGYVFRFDEAAIRSRVQNEPLSAELMPTRLPALSFSVELGQGRAAFGAPQADRLLLYSPAPGGGTATWVALESPLACAVTPWGEGLVAPLDVGQVFYLAATDGNRLAAPFQPMLEPRTTWPYQPAAPTADARQFVITDGRDTIYLVALVDQPQPHLEAVAEAKVAHPIESPIVVQDDAAFAVAGSSHLARFALPSLEPAGDANLPAPVVWGPFPAGEMLLLATADQQLLAVSAAGDVAWQASLAQGDLVGAPLVANGSVVLACRNGTIERRSLTDGQPQATVNVEQPLAAGPVLFLNRLVLTTGDGTLLVVDQP